MQLTVSAMRCDPFFEATQLATATAFFYAHNGGVWLVTAWHNVTGLHSETKQLLNPELLCLPDRLRLWVAVESPPPPGSPPGTTVVGWVEVWIELYEDDERAVSRFRWHPELRESLDVVAIPVPLPDGAMSKPINDPSFGLTPVIPRAGDEAVVLGFPLGLAAAGHLAIWKRASIASEPSIADYPPQPPKIYLDTASRQGMSGGPVFLRRYGTMGEEDYVAGQAPPPEQRPFMGESRRFLGVYTGRLGGDDELAAQLGIVATERAIGEVIDAAVRADTVH